MTSEEFSGLVAVVTGGASGIGSAIARLFVERGAQVAVLDIDPQRAPDGVLAVATDIGDADSVRDAIAIVVGRLGGIDIVVNNAAVGAQGTVEDNSDDEWARVLSVNVTGIARVSRTALPHLRKSSHPSIVNTCSIAATAGLPQRALYSASKGAVLALTRAMAADYVHENIRVNCVNPGTANTPWVARLLEKADDPDAERRSLELRQPHRRLVEMDEVADAVLYLASPRAGSTTGASVAVDGGMQNLRVR